LPVYGAALGALALLHPFVPNHCKLEKSLMRAHLGEYERLEARLKRAVSRERGALATA